MLTVLLVALLGFGAWAVVAGNSSDVASPSAAAAVVREPAAEPQAAPPTVTAQQIASCGKAAIACVDLDAKQAWLQRDGVVVTGPVPMLPGTETGKRAPGPNSSATPTGAFSVQRKDADAHSNEFDEPMPHAVYFAPGGIAFHEGSLTTTSNGCIHLSREAATTFFNQLKIGDGVTVF